MAEQIFEREVQDLIDEVRREKQKAELKLESIRRVIEAADRKLEALETTINVYRAKYGLPAVASRLNAGDYSEYTSLPAKEQIRRWDSKHQGTVVMKDLCKAMVAAGSYQNKRQAAGTLYPTIRRMPEYEKIGRGLYHRRDTNGAKPAQALAPVVNGQGQPQSFSVF